MPMVQGRCEQRAAEEPQLAVVDVAGDDLGAQLEQLRVVRVDGQADLTQWVLAAPKVSRRVKRSITWPLS
jgi:hypothetical protein